MYHHDVLNVTGHGWSHLFYDVRPAESHFKMSGIHRITSQFKALVVEFQKRNPWPKQNEAVEIKIPGLLHLISPHHCLEGVKQGHRASGPLSRFQAPCTILGPTVSAHLSVLASVYNESFPLPCFWPCQESGQVHGPVFCRLCLVQGLTVDTGTGATAHWRTKEARQSKDRAERRHFCLRPRDESCGP